MSRKIQILLLIILAYVPVSAQRNCGQQAMLQYIETQQPGSIQKVMDEKSNAFSLYENYVANNVQSKNTSKTSAQSIIIPVVFQIVLDSNQFKQLGGTEGIKDRVTTQMRVINEDFNGKNPDKVKVPAVWESVFGNVNISFGLARVAPNGDSSQGYNIKIVPNGTSYSADNAGKLAKFSTSGGLDAWDNTKYFNIWIVNLKTSGSTALGITVPPGFPAFTKPELGISLNYLAFGARTSAGQSFINKFDKGRTLTHEIGHYFYLWHTWGDDGGLCPDNGGSDDGFSDTPPEADASTGAPRFPRFDACSPSGNGIMFMNYMDYSDDTALFMFTRQQAAMVNSQLAAGGQSYSLTLHPELIDIEFKETGIKVFPNPTQGILYIKYDEVDNPLQRIIVYNMLGQKIIETTEQGIKSIDMSFWSKGIYFVHLYFNKEIIKQKISLQ